MRLAANLLILASLSAGMFAPVCAQPLYKNVMPDGHVIYSDKPIQGARQATPMEMPAAPTAAQMDAARKRAETDKRQRDELQGRLDARRKATEAAETRVTKAARALEDAQVALERGREAQAGDMAGVAGGGVRPGENYFRRLADLERRVEDARRELDEARRASKEIR